MKVPIDMLNVTTGWGGTAGAGFSLNQNPGDCMAEYQTASLLIYVPPNSQGKTITKAISPSVSLAGCTEIVLSIWSRELKRTRLPNPAAYFYQITFDGVNYFMLPTNIAFSDVTFGINGWGPATQITIVPTSNNEDWLIISCCYALWDEQPLDILQGVQIGIEWALPQFLPSGGIPLGTIAACAAGATSVVPSFKTYLERGAVLLFTNGSVSETHQVGRYDEASGAVWFTSLFSGSSMVNAFSGASAYLLFPVQYGVQEQEAAVPGITLWTMAGRNSQDTEDVYQYEDSLSPAGAGAMRRTPWMQRYKVLIDCESRSHQNLALMGRIVRRFMAQNRVWINGRAHDVEYPDDAVYLEPKEGVVNIPKLQYELDVEIHEERAARVWAPAVSGNATITVTMSNPAPLGEPAIP
jgi:hypothetical protein